MTTNISHGIAVCTGGAILSLALVHPTPARADKKKTFKTAAIVLGAAAVYMGVKKKTVPAVIAGAGAYYAYKKSKNADNQYATNNGDVYPEQYGYNVPDDYSYPSTTSDPGYYGNDDPYYAGNDTYPTYGFAARKTTRTNRALKPVLK